MRNHRGPAGPAGLAATAAVLLAAGALTACAAPADAPAGAQPGRTPAAATATATHPAGGSSTATSTGSTGSTGSMGMQGMQGMQGMEGMEGMEGMDHGQLSVTIMISGSAYSVAGPVSPGQYVTVINHDPQTHTITSTAPGAFDVPVPQGQLVTFPAPHQAGSYPFSSREDPAMHGVLVVR